MPVYETEVELRPDHHSVEDPMVLHIEIDLVISSHPVAPSGWNGPPEFYDPGSGAEWEFDVCRIDLGSRTSPSGAVHKVPDLAMTCDQFDAFFGPQLADLLWEAAQEYASETYDPMDYMEDPE